MLLLVGLANIIMQHARQSDPAALATSPASGALSNTDPLADIGVAPLPETAASGASGGAAR